jgi:hypothetical protein
MNRKSIAIALALPLFLAGCAGAELMTGGKPADLGDGVTVTPSTNWARVHAPGMDTFWTIDGMGLNELRYYTGIAPGKPIIDVSGMKNAEIGLYAANMLPNDIMDLLASNLAKAGNQEVHTANLAPAKFGAANGFRFDLNYLTKDGLKMRGEALIAQRGGKLDVLLFVAPDEYYFAHRQPDADQLFATVQASG